MRPRNFGAAYHIERAIAMRQGISQYPCACSHCHGGRTRSTALVAKHHRQYGRDPYLRFPVLVSLYACSILFFSFFKFSMKVAVHECDIRTSIILDRSSSSFYTIFIHILCIAKKNLTPANCSEAFSSHIRA